MFQFHQTEPIRRSFIAPLRLDFWRIPIREWTDALSDGVLSGMITLGLTGGLGMGKSTTAQFLHERGAQVIDTDELARQLVQPGQPALSEIQAVFGKNIVAPDGRIAP